MADFSIKTRNCISQISILAGDTCKSPFIKLYKNSCATYVFFEIYLSTKDAQGFYERCGYNCCDPVITVCANAAFVQRYTRNLYKNNKVSESH